MFLNYSLFLLLINSLIISKLYFFDLKGNFILYSGIPFGGLFAIFLLFVYLWYREKWILISVANIFNLTLLMLWVNNLINSQLNNYLELITDFANWKVVISFILALLVSIFIIWWGDFTLAYISLFTSYIIIANVAYSWDWPLIWFPLCYLFSLIIFNCIVLIKQFLSADVKKINRKYILIFLGLYGLTVCLFAINEFIPNSPLKHLLQPYGVKERFFILADLLEKKLSNFVIDLQSFWCNFNLAYSETIPNSLVNERPNPLILEVRVKNKVTIVKGYGSRSSSAFVINSEISASSNNSSTAAKKYVIAQNRAFVGEHHSFIMPATKFTAAVDADINTAQELQKVKRDFKYGNDLVGPSTISRYLPPHIAPSPNNPVLVPTIHNEYRTLLNAPTLAQNSIFSNYREICTAAANNRINNVNSKTLVTTPPEGYSEDFAREYHNCDNYPVLSDEFTYLALPELERSLDSVTSEDFKFGKTTANLTHIDLLGGHYVFILFLPNSKYALVQILTTAPSNKIGQTTFNNEILNTASKRILIENGVKGRAEAATLPLLKEMIDPDKPVYKTPADGFKQRVAPTLLVIEYEDVPKFIEFKNIKKLISVNATLTFKYESETILNAFRTIIKYSIDPKTNSVKALTLKK